MGKAARAQESPAGDSPVMAFPFPAGVSPMVAEEARPVPHFTLREQQVGGWLAEGKTDPEIVRILGMGIETVRTHIKSMREKAEVENRSALLAWINYWT